MPCPRQLVDINPPVGLKVAQNYENFRHRHDVQRRRFWIGRHLRVKMQKLLFLSKAFVQDNHSRLPCSAFFYLLVMFIFLLNTWVLLHLFNTTPTKTALLRVLSSSFPFWQLTKHESNRLLKVNHEPPILLGRKERKKKERGLSYFFHFLFTAREGERKKHPIAQQSNMCFLRRSDASSPSTREQQKKKKKRTTNETEKCVGRETFTFFLCEIYLFIAFFQKRKLTLKILSPAHHTLSFSALSLVLTFCEERRRS